jgi:hypothetical protein
MQFVRGDTVINSTLASTTSYTLDRGSPVLDLVAIQAIYSNGTTSAKTFTSGVEVDQVTFASKVSSGDGDYFVLSDYSGLSWAVALDTTGLAANTPTGAAWVAVPSGRKVYTDISAATTGSDIATAVLTAINALTGFSAKVTGATSTTHINFTNALPGAVTAPAVYSKAGAAGTGSITKAVTIAGAASKISVSNDTITITAHGQATGSKGQVTTSVTLPGGISGSTDYFVIAVDANTIKLATSLANAVAGTAVDITDVGVGTQTFTPTTSTSNVLKLQASCDNVNFQDISGDTVTIATSSGNTLWDLQRPGYRYIKILYTPSAGQIALQVVVNGWADK